MKILLIERSNVFGLGAMSLTLLGLATAEVASAAPTRARAEQCVQTLSFMSYIYTKQGTEDIAVKLAGRAAQISAKYRIGGSTAKEIAQSQTVLSGRAQAIQAEFQGDIKKVRLKTQEMRLCFREFP